MALGEKPPTLLWFIRHGEVEEPYQNVFGGRIDMGLSPRGAEQARALATCLRAAHFDAVYASPMKRVQQTLAPYLGDGLPAPIILPGLREVDFGDWTGLTWEDVMARYRVSASTWLEQLENGRMTNAETVPTLQKRVEPCLRRMLREHQGGQVAVFCHGGVIRLAVAILLGWPLSNLRPIEFEYASVTQIACGDNRAQLRLVNFTPWRELAS